MIYDQILKLGQLKDLQKLNFKDLFDLISIHAFSSFDSDWFTKISKDTLIDLLDNDSLLIDEIDLFSACLKWMKCELTRQNKEFNLNNQLELFNSIKNLIRFPSMNRNQFFGIKKKLHKDSFIPTEMEIIAPSKTGLFTKEELDEFERYFETGNPKVFSTNYKLTKRGLSNVARLDYNYRTHTYQMVNYDYDKLLNDSGHFIYRDVNGGYTDDGLNEIDGSVLYDGNFVFFEDGFYTDDLLIKSQNQPVNDPFDVYLHDQYEDYTDIEIEEHYISSPSSDESNDEIKIIKEIKHKDTIYVFKIQINGGDDRFGSNHDFEIHDSDFRFHRSNLKKHQRFYRRDNQSYFTFFPMIPLKLNRSYRMQASYMEPHRHVYGKTDFQLKKILIKDGQIDVQLELIGCRNPCAWRIYFTY